MCYLYMLQDYCAVLLMKKAFSAAFLTIKPFTKFIYFKLKPSPMLNFLKSFEICNYIPKNYKTSKLFEKLKRKKCLMFPLVEF